MITFLKERITLQISIVSKPILTMNKLLKCIVLAFLIAPTVGYADLKKVYHNDWNPDTQIIYWILFVARDYFPGHAFVVLGERNRKKSVWKSLKGYGKYAKNTEKKNAKKAAYGVVPGKIVEESAQSLRSVNNGLAVAVPKEVYNYVLRNTKYMQKKSSKKPVPYSLIDKSCVDFTEMAARAVGLKVPTPNGHRNHPQLFIAELKRLN